ncbi:pyroglutamyl-peptidase I [Sporolactobacillus shoreicorticis]|uniref:Pyrrolidone-carboxylate peptidase n=1 Tax=Sporolactobacillus shoreicorticis TaxID=1923877 RepID=A0ABW5S8J0_9BACL|nr:pyroglutamyl-peptidase I [Sporolactobacillus shoreicorticis]MCO7125943.1 pyroglutamyl-peptidase I [Sporolactobacillus shoreicorticis]
MRVLLSGFAPFGGSGLNPSWEAVRRLDGVQATNTVELFATKLPVSYREAADRLFASVRVICPDVIIAVGQAGGREAITPELFAMNRSNSENPDNEGIVLTDQMIVEDGPEKYKSALPVHEIIWTIQKLGIPVELSENAGGFVCNHVFYKLMHELEKNGKSKIGGFIHVPFLPEQTLENDAPSVGIDQLTEALKQAAIVSAAAFSETATV